LDEELYYFTCPYCWSSISMMFDCSVASQTYIEDCEVCCRPIEVTYTSDGETVTGFSAEQADP
jgi:hypothetical protein